MDIKNIQMDPTTQAIKKMGKDMEVENYMTNKIILFMQANGKMINMKAKDY